MSWHRYFVVITLVLGVMVGCAMRPLSSNTMMFTYEDFGPSVMASNLLGQEWWQWQSEGDGNPATHYPVKVIVYWDIPLDKVKQAYPVVPEKRQDYRYVERKKALDFLTSAIRDAKDFEFGQNSMLITLQTTQKKISKGSNDE